MNVYATLSEIWLIRERENEHTRLTIKEAEALAKDLERAIMTYKHAQAEKMSPEQIERFMELATYEEG